MTTRIYTGILALMVLALASCARMERSFDAMFGDDPAYVAEMNTLQKDFLAATGKDLCLFDQYQENDIYPSSCIFINKVPFVISAVPTNDDKVVTTLVSYTENSIDGAKFVVFNGTYSRKPVVDKYPPFFVYDGVNSSYFLPENKEMVPLASFKQITVANAEKYKKLIKHLFRR